MHVNQRLVQYLESTIDHSLPQVELWSISKKVAINLYEHKTIPIQFDLKSLK
jgi:hypothetical protein